MDSTRLILIGLGGVLLGVALPLLMVIGVLEPTFWLALIAYVVSLGGLIMGLLGAALYARGKQE